MSRRVEGWIITTVSTGPTAGTASGAAPLLEALIRTDVHALAVATVVSDVALGVSCLTSDGNPLDKAPAALPSGNAVAVRVSARSGD